MKTKQVELLFEQRVKSGTPVQMVRVEFDGGTPCNIPRLGYGIGYGSYQINDSPIIRIDHKVPMSCNVAEIATLVCALEEVRAQYGTGVGLTIHGDSQNALAWSKKELNKSRLKRMTTDKNPVFMAAVRRLRAAIEPFPFIETHWRGRAASVKLFVH